MPARSGGRRWSPSRCVNSSPRRAAEYFLRVAFTLAKDQLWAKKGYEVAAGQFQLPISAPVAAETGAKPVTLAQDDKTVTVAGDGFTVVFDQGQGTISALKRDGVNVLAAGGGPRLHLWRAPHRNDDMWAYDDWVKYGLDRPQVRRRQPHRLATGPNRCSSWRNQGRGQERLQRAPRGDYTITATARSPSTTTSSSPGPRDPAGPAGRAIVAGQAARRSTSSAAARWRTTPTASAASTWAFTAARRQRAVRLREADGARQPRGRSLGRADRGGLPGLLAQANGDLLQVSALPHTDEEMTPVEYKIDLPASEATVFCLGAKTLGVGSNGCGPRPSTVHRLVEPATFSYVLHAIPPGPTSDLPALGRSILPHDRVLPVLAHHGRDGRVQLSRPQPRAHASNTPSMAPRGPRMQSPSSTPQPILSRCVPGPSTCKPTRAWSPLVRSTCGPAGRCPR